MSEKKTKPKVKLEKQITIGFTNDEVQFIDEYCELNMITRSKFIRKITIDSINKERFYKENGKY